MTRTKGYVGAALFVFTVTAVLLLARGHTGIALLAAFLPIVVLTRPVTLAVTAVFVDVLVNAQWLPVPQSLRFFLLGLLAVSLVLAMLSGRRRNVIPNLVAPVAAVLILLAFASWSNQAISYERGAAFVLLLVVMVFFPQVTSVDSIVRTWRILFIVVTAYLLGGSVIRFGVSPGSLFLIGFFRGPMANPNAFGLLAGAAAVYFASAGDRSGLSPVVRRTVVVLLLLGVAVSGCRSADLGLATVFLVHVVKGSQGRKAAAFALIGLLSFFLSKQLAVEATREERWPVWVRATKAAVHSPFRGVGFGATETAIRSGRLPVPAVFQGVQLHNSYVQVLYEFGLVPGLLFLAVLGILVVRSLRGGQSVPGLTPLRGVVIFGLVSALAESWMFSTGSVFGAVFWLAVGSLWVAESAPGAEARAPSDAAAALSAAVPSPRGGLQL